MFPLWPSINPSLIGSLMNNGTSAGATNEEQEISALEQEQQNYLNLVETNAQDLIPLGKLPNGDGANADGDSDQDSAASDDQESSASEAEDQESEDGDNDIELT